MALQCFWFKGKRGFWVYSEMNVERVCNSLTKGAFSQNLIAAAEDSVMEMRLEDLIIWEWA